MKWIKPYEYARKRIDKSGDLLSKGRTPKNTNIQELINIFNNWRSSHAYPMHIIMMTIKNTAKDITDKAICFQRLKRVSSILYKLERYTMKLSQMQDIAGCRVIMPDVELARKMSKDFISRKKKHKRVKKREINYINSPKSDGYRGIHLVYEYYSTNNGARAYNGKMIEIQIRSRLQHSWATAVETVDLFSRNKNRMKFGGGDERWRRFFKLMSSAFAIEEDCPLVNGTPQNKEELYLEIVNLSKELKVAGKLNGWRYSLDYLKPKEGKYFILILDTKRKQIKIKSEKDDEKISKFLREYYSLERKYKEDENYDVVLVGSASVKSLRKGYPNYFADTEEFLNQLNKIEKNFNSRA